MKLGERIITKADILDKLNEEDIFEYYFSKKLGYQFKIEPNTMYINPFRDDEDPGCNFYYNPLGRLKFHDHSAGYNWDCFNIAQMYYSCNFGEALNLIARDFKVSEISYDQKKVIQRKQLTLESHYYRNIQVKIRKWTYSDENYWGQFYLDKKLLTTYNVHPISHAWMESGGISNMIYDYNYKDPGFCYYFGNDNKGNAAFKLYFPLRPKGGLPRFYHTNSSIIQGAREVDANAPFIVITKSLKDVMCLRLFNINAIAPMSESIILTGKQMTNIRKRFPTVYTLFDRDKAGMRSSIKYREVHGTIPLLMPSDYSKDFSDSLKDFGHQEMLDIIEHAKSELL
jgi:hypothetical protein